MSKREEKILGHDYDGIHEYDNPLPGWWLFIFYGSMVWALLYAVFFHFGPGLLPEQRHDAEMRALRIEAARAAIMSGEVTDENVQLVALSPEHVDHGAQIFQERCAKCHRPDGGGDVGPNLTDKYWLDGGSPAEIHATIRDGVHQEGMPTWSWKIRPDEVWAAAAYVETLRGTNVVNGKEPQGQPWEPGTPSAARRAALTATLQEVLDDPAAVARGQQVFMVRCLACHGPQGGGLVGPNLTDDHWIHGGGLADIFHTVMEGVPEKGMISWKKQLSRQEIQDVVAFVASIRGTNAPGKPPEGEPWTPEMETAENPAGL